MSDLSPNNQTNATEELAASAVTAKGEINALLEGVRSQKAAFDVVADTSTKDISATLDGAKTVSQQITALKSEAVSSKNAMETERNEFVSKTKATLTEIETTRNDIAKIKGGIDATQKAIATDAGVVSQSKTDVEKLESSASALSEKLTKEHADIATKIAALKEAQTALQGVLKEISDTKDAANEEGKSVSQCLEDVKATKDKFTTLGTEADSAQAALAAKQNALEAKITEIEEANAKIVDLRRKLLESSDDTKSVQDEISELRSGISNILKEVSAHKETSTKALDQLVEKANKDAQEFSAKQVDSFGTLYSNLKTTIESLLPSAGAAGLSSTYYDAKSRYAPTSFSGKPGAEGLKGFWGGVRKLFGYNPASIVATVSFYTMFIVPIALIVWIFFDFLRSLPSGPHPIDVDYKLLLLRVFIALPLAAISGFGFNSLRLYRKLYEEYNHKQRVMELYQSFKAEVDKVGSDEQKKELLTIMLNSVANKAWNDTLDAPANSKGLGAFSNLERAADDIAKIKSIFS